MPQVHKANLHSKRAGNLSMNRAYKRKLEAHCARANRADRRLPLRLIHAANIEAKRLAKLAAAANSGEGAA